jgi:putative DNA primase/helicase
MTLRQPPVQTDDEERFAEGQRLREIFDPYIGMEDPLGCHGDLFDCFVAAHEDFQRLEDSSDGSLAHFIAPRVEGNLLFDPAENAWYGQTDGMWSRQRPGFALDVMHSVSRIPLEAPDDPRSKHLEKLNSNRKARDVMTRLGSMKQIEASGDIWDRNPWLLGTPSGVVDLRTAQLVEVTPGMYVRRRTSVPFVPLTEETYPHKFIEATQLILPDPEVWRYVMRALGYAITGITQEQLWFFFYGRGSNGKTFLAETVRLILGNSERGGYAYEGKPDTFIVSKTSNPINYGSAMNGMRGARFVIVPEVSHGELDTDLMKRLSGGDPVTYRAPYGRTDVTYTPSAHLVMYGNARPTITDSSHGNWRRLIEVPFEVTVPEEKRVKNYWEVLVKEEGPGILRLLIEAARQYHDHGLLPVPDVIRKATDEYRATSDPFSLWLGENCVQEVRTSAKAFDLFRDYDMWCSERNERPLGANLFYARLGQLGLAKVARKDGKHYLGVGLLSAI